MKRKHLYTLSLAIFAAANAFSQITLNPVPSRAVGVGNGVTDFATTIHNFNPNLVEGREFYNPAGVALDTSVSPPILYVSDYGNNRVLAWKNSSSFSNGQAADLVIGQPDLLTTLPGGPAAGSSSWSTSGLYGPSGVAVDASGNLYVADTGNNRILRYQAPFKGTSQFPLVDLVIGQADKTGYAANYTGAVSAQGISISGYQISLAFDSSGDLWMTDAGNVRVLEFSRASLTGSLSGGLSAAQVLGQPNLTTKQAALSTSNASSYRSSTQLIAPISLAFDSSGNLYVGDSVPSTIAVPAGVGFGGRVLVFASGATSAAQILGIFPSGYTFPTDPTTLQTLFDRSCFRTPSAIFFPGGSVGVVDASFNRIMVFNGPATWPSDGSSPMATTWPPFGQPSACTQYVGQSCKYPNNGNPQAANNTLYVPWGVAYTGTDLYLADSGNNRVLDLPVQSSTVAAAKRVLGQDYFSTNSINLIEGREFRFTAAASGSTISGDAAMAIDSFGSTPHLYVADPYNNRILGFRDMRQFTVGGANKADIVLGQADFTTALVNYPSNDPTKPTSSGLFHPVGLLVDPSGNLYVADFGNGRVLRFPAPFAYTGTAPEPADLVLGQSGFTTTDTTPSRTNMTAPYGLAFSPSCDPLSGPCSIQGLAVSDAGANRVLYFAATNGAFNAGTDNGKAATYVFGQPGFTSSASGSGPTNMNSPRHLSSDANGLLYVADSGNNRILVFDDPAIPSTANGESYIQVITTYLGTSLSAPVGIYVNPHTYEIWVANAGNGKLIRYDNYTAAAQGTSSVAQIQDLTYSLAVAQDQYGALFVADVANRVIVYYPGMLGCNGANFIPTSYPNQTAAALAAAFSACLNTTSTTASPRPLAPGMWATFKPCATCGGFAKTAQTVSAPFPTTIQDVEVLFDGVLTHMDYAAPGQVNFIIPNAANHSGYSEVEVVQASTGRVLGAAQVLMSAVAPGLFYGCGSGSTATAVYVCAINVADGTINGSSNPVARGSYISIYGTGVGYIAGAAPDGTPGTTPISAPAGMTTVYLNGVQVDDPAYGGSSPEHLQFSGLNAIPGDWQINVLIPSNVDVSTTKGQILLSISLYSQFNYDPVLYKTYIAVK